MLSKIIFCTLLLLSISSCTTESKKDTKFIDSNMTHVSSLSFDFSTKLAGWRIIYGDWQWVNSELIQNSTNNNYPLILNTSKALSQSDISVRFKPISGNVDASGGIVFRAKDGNNYYVVRANALEGNYRLYYFEDGIRHQIASASISTPTLGKWHTMRVVAIGNHIQAYLDDILQINHHDNRYSKGFVGLWTKEDSITAFDNLNVSGE